MSQSPNFRTLLQCALRLDKMSRESSDPNVGARLGWYSAARARLCFYDVAPTPAKLAEIRAALDVGHISYRLVVEQPDARFSNIQILDIDL